MQPTQQTKTAIKDTGTEKLDDCLQHELSAMETYELALKSISHVGLHHELQEILASHSRRAELLREKIRSLGAEAATSSGVGGAFFKVVQAGADVLGDRAAIAVLEEGEDRLLRLYAEGLEGCNVKTRLFIETHLLPEQRRTHELCRTMKAYVKSPS